jgi:coatomer subunit beta'
MRCSGLYNGSVNIWNYQTGALLRTFEVTDVPVRCVKYIARKNWFVAGKRLPILLPLA